MDAIVVVGVGALLVFGLLLRSAILSARLEGFREGQRFAESTNRGDGAGQGCLEVFAAIGLAAICLVVFYLGLTASAWSR